MRRDVGIGVLFGVIILVVAGVYYFRSGPDENELLVLESFRPPPPVLQAASLPLRQSEVQPRQAESARQTGANRTASDRGVTPPQVAARSAPADRPDVEPVRPLEPRIPPAETRPAATQPTPAFTPIEPANDVRLPRRHRVKSGETLTQIAQRYYGDSRMIPVIQRANPEIRDENKLREGMTLLIPERPREPAPRAEGRERAAAPPEPRDAATRDAAPITTYTVRDGDSLYGIAARLLGSGNRWREIHQLNRELLGSDANHLRPGMLLKIPPREPAAKRPPR